MRVAFHDLKVRLQRPIVKRVGKLAKPAADVRDDAALAKFAAGDEALKAARSPDLLPKTEYRSRGNLDSVEPLDRESQIMDLAGDEKALLRLVLGPQTGRRCRDDLLILEMVPDRMTPDARTGEVDNGTTQLKQHRLAAKDRRVRVGWCAIGKGLGVRRHKRCTNET